MHMDFFSPDLTPEKSWQHHLFHTLNAVGRNNKYSLHFLIF